MDQPQTKELLFTRLPAGAQPSSFLPAGPWCLSDVEEVFPNWEKTFAFPPEPLAEQKALLFAIQACKGLTAALCPRVAATLCPWSHTLPARYWEFLLTPWLGRMAEQIVERWLRIEALCNTYADTRLTVSLLPEESSFSFQDEAETTLAGAFGMECNHWLFSTLLRNRGIPSLWTVREEKSPAVNKNQQKKRSTIQDLLRRFALSLPFPHLKGVSIIQSLRFSLALCHTSKGPDQSRPLAGEEEEKAFEALKLPCDPLQLVIPTLPRSIRELDFPKVLKKTSHPRIRCASILAYEDARYRERLARFLACGNRLFFVQHGGNYGQIKKACLTAMVEYTQHAFISWGWEADGEETTNVHPLPYPQLNSIQNSWQKTTEDMLFVGTEMPLFGYRLDSHPTPLGIVAYREAKRRFFAALPPEVQQRFLYRPYFALPSSLSDAPWLMQAFPALRLCTGPLLAHLLGTSLLILDHHGTSLLEAMAAGVPTLLFWERKSWPLTDACQTMIDQLAACGIYHETPEGAAKKLCAIKDDINAWWQSLDVRQARASFSQRYARTAKNADALWINCLQNL